MWNETVGKHTVEESKIVETRVRQLLRKEQMKKQNDKTHHMRMAGQKKTTEWTGKNHFPVNHNCSSDWVMTTTFIIKGFYNYSKALSQIKQEKYTIQVNLQITDPEI